MGLPTVKDTLNDNAVMTDIIPSIFRAVDTVLDSAIGVRIVEPAGEIIHDILPANVIRNVTGIPKPSEAVIPVIENIKRDIKNTVNGRKLSLPGLN